MRTLAARLSLILVCTYSSYVFANNAETPNFAISREIQLLASESRTIGDFVRRLPASERTFQLRTYLRLRQLDQLPMPRITVLQDNGKSSQRNALDVDAIREGRLVWNGSSLKIPPNMPVGELIDWISKNSRAKSASAVLLSHFLENASARAGGGSRSGSSSSYRTIVIFNNINGSSGGGALPSSVAAVFSGITDHFKACFGEYLSERMPECQLVSESYNFIKRLKTISETGASVEIKKFACGNGRLESLEYKHKYGGRSYSFELNYDEKGVLRKIQEPKYENPENAKYPPWEANHYIENDKVIATEHYQPPLSGRTKRPVDPPKSISDALLEPANFPWERALSCAANPRCCTDVTDFIESQSPGAGGTKAKSQRTVE